MRKQGEAISLMTELATGTTYARNVEIIKSEQGRKSLSSDDSSSESNSSESVSLESMIEDERDRHF